MKRIDIYYGGDHFSIANRDPDEVLAEIAHASASNEPTWFTVNIGEGSYQPAHLLLQPGVPVAVVPIPDPLP